MNTKQDENDMEKVEGIETDGLENKSMETEQKASKKPDEDFKCEICDFRSLRKNGLLVHMGFKHKTIVQLDGNNDEDSDDSKDDIFTSTENYWRTGKLGTSFQAFLDANSLVDDSGLDEEERTIEKELILDASKRAFGDEFRFYPPRRKF